MKKYDNPYSKKKVDNRIHHSLNIYKMISIEKNVWVERTNRKFDDGIPDNVADVCKACLHFCTSDELYFFSSSENAFS